MSAQIICSGLAQAALRATSMPTITADLARRHHGVDGACQGYLPVSAGRVRAAARSAAAASRVSGSPWPKQATVSRGWPAGEDDAAAWVRLTLNTPQVTVPSWRRAAASPLNRTRWRGRHSAMLPGVWPGTATVTAPSPKPGSSPSRARGQSAAGHRSRRERLITLVVKGPFPAGQVRRRPGFPRADERRVGVVREHLDLAPARRCRRRRRCGRRGSASAPGTAGPRAGIRPGGSPRRSGGRSPEGRHR